MKLKLFIVSSPDISNPNEKAPGVLIRDDRFGDFSADDIMILSSNTQVFTSAHFEKAEGSNELIMIEYEFYEDEQLDIIMIKTTR